MPQLPEQIASDGGLATVTQSALRTLDVQIAGMTTLREALADGLDAALSQVVDLVLGSSGRVIVSGMGKSGHIGRKIAATLASTGTPAFFMHPAEASHGDLGMVAGDDLVLALSWSGETRELGDIASYTRRYQVPLVAVTSERDSTLGRAADLVLALPKVTEACPHGLAPTTSTLLQLALGDAIAIALLERRSFTPAHFHRFHPGGKLGSILRTAGDLMRRAPDIAAVGPQVTLGAAVIEMTTRSLGSAFVVDEEDRVLGVVTDGDLRRHLRGDFLARPVCEVMTPRPVSCAPDMLGSAALALMSRHKVNALAVVSGERIVGVLTMHMLLAAGIV
ncbi:KpsF/GutQ family sugar-phosphate isomerase [Aurantimonas sp. Leaf443]|uniref:KpsF/GutQ family sugar-phosphate isomerase n=1 Tax=Aurantimonas sp. Leaf443 TaxID=1736378 RepID=UPI0006FE12C3|nr:KpsF/GutQ family sugar-phosphate isomerase [Aurantimonas sp. Leaf443]KQT84027.1 KpsF/GutQ family protein [Aurantimonas sp. Leaf443]